MTRQPGQSEADSCIFHSGILYINLPVFRACLASTPAAARLVEMPSVKSIEQLRDCLSNLQLWCKKSLAEAQLKVAPLKLTDVSESLLHGDVRSFQFSVRTRGVGYWGVNRLHIGDVYRKKNGRVLSLAIDPAWVTCDHGYVKLTSGNTTICGIFLVRHIDQENNIILGEPIVLGEPVSETCGIIDPDGCYLLCKNPPS